MIDNGRLFRAVVMGITLVICIWALNRLESRKNIPAVVPVDTTRTEEAIPQEEASLAAPAMDAETLPLVALDNTCYYSDAHDLSGCTGTLSGGPSREYRIVASDATQILYVGAVPRSEYFDLSLALLTADEQCLIGYDNSGPGLPERAVVSGLEPGEYLLVVSGYADNCGPYELTVFAEAPDIARVVDMAILNGKNGKVVRWETFAEIGVQHFVLYRTQGDRRERVAVLRAHGSPAGFANYRVMDRAPQPDSTYEIEAVARDGRKELVSIAV